MSASLKRLLLLSVLLYGTEGCNNESASGPELGLQPADAPNTERILDKEDYQRALTLKNRGIGHLENKEWADAESALAELAQVLPNNLLARRNHAVARVLTIIDSESPYQQSGPAEKKRQYAAAVADAEETLTSYDDIATRNYDVALAAMLRGKLLVHAKYSNNSNFQTGLKTLRKAADLLPNEADFRFAEVTAMDGERLYTNANTPESAELLASRIRTCELAPQNLFAIRGLLQRQALSLRSTHKPTMDLALKISDTLNSAQALVAPLNESIKKRNSEDVVATIRAALAKFDGTNPTVLVNPALMSGNLLVAELATQIDMRRLNRNLLEYLLLEFDDEFLAAASKAGAIPASTPTVVKGFVAIDGLPKLTGVTHIEMQDMNLDGFDDLIVAHSEQIAVYSRGTDLNSEWELMMTSPKISIGVTKFLLADIDRDFDKALSDIKNPSLLRDADGDQKLPKDPAGKNRWYDTDLDVVAWSNKGVVVLRNTTDEDGTRSLRELPQKEAIQGVNDVVAADMEADGDLDFIFATNDGMTLWKNIDGTTFENMNASAALPEHQLASLSVVDWNSDIGIDVVGASSDGKYGYLENIFHGRFRWMPLEVDLSGSNFVIGHRSGMQRWGITATGPSFFAETADLDNDGFSDMVFGTGDGVAWRRGLPNGGFDQQETRVSDTKSSASAIADYDDDGDLDIIVVDSESGVMSLLLNDGGNTNNWVDVVVRAVSDDPQFPSNRVNMHSIGSVIEMRAGGLYHAEVINQPRVHLGLGQAKSADAIRVIWTDGIPQNVMVPDLLQPRVGILAPQILKGSCPYIYTWTGEQFEFFSDCLWAAPIGLVQANGEIAPTREWENLLIPGEALLEKDGSYMIQLTEELWETAYFDQVQLTAIDHPADVSIFTNEKVGPPHMAEHRVHTVRNARLPASVTDSRGRDLLPGLETQDGNYVQPFQGRVLQGLTDEWTMEFDLGDIDQPDNIRLFLLGWVFPTDTSLNLGIEQNPNLNPPAGPSLEIPDGHGAWKVARPFIGFPSGKTKAMVVDISDIFDSEDYRFRIKSSMELYWDRAFFTVNETDAETHSQACELASGNLHFRGFSRRLYADNALFRYGHAPESYDYASVTTDPRWPPISGRFTGYGNTTPLLWEHDDQMVVMGPGDELTLSFEVPKNLVPKGWKRDFVLMNVGYDKDADLNTIYGQSSEPFPFRAMSRYPFAPGDDVPDSPEHRNYIREWQTREYSARPFWNALQNEPAHRNIRETQTP